MILPLWVQQKALKVLGNHCLPGRRGLEPSLKSIYPCSPFRPKASVHSELSQAYLQPLPVLVDDFVLRYTYSSRELWGLPRISPCWDPTQDSSMKRKQAERFPNKPFWTFPHLTLDQFSSNYTVVREKAEHISGLSMLCLWPLSQLLPYDQILLLPEDPGFRRGERGWRERGTRVLSIQLKQNTTGYREWAKGHWKSSCCRVGSSLGISHFCLEQCTEPQGMWPTVCFI